MASRGELGAVAAISPASGSRPAAATPPVPSPEQALQGCSQGDGADPCDALGGRLQKVCNQIAQRPAFIVSAIPEPLVQSPRQRGRDPLRAAPHEFRCGNSSSRAPLGLRELVNHPAKAGWSRVRQVALRWPTKPYAACSSAAVLDAADLQHACSSGGSAPDGKALGRAGTGMAADGGVMGASGGVAGYPLAPVSQTRCQACRRNHRGCGTSIRPLPQSSRCR